MPVRNKFYPSIENVNVSTVFDVIRLFSTPFDDSLQSVTKPAFVFLV